MNHEDLKDRKDIRASWHERYKPSKGPHSAAFQHDVAVRLANFSAFFAVFVVHYF
jgi:hypothetical protein